MLNMRDPIPWSRSREVATGTRELKHPFVALQREMDRVFDGFWRGFDLPGLGPRDSLASIIAPRVNVSANEKQIVVTAELPGMTQGDQEKKAA